MDNNTNTIEKKVTANSTILDMMLAIHKNDLDLFYKSAETYLSNLARSNESYDRIRRLIAEKPKKLIQLKDLSADIRKLITFNIDYNNENVFLNNDIQILIDELLIEWKNIDAYKSHNIPIRNKILLHGATGNGKTTIARYIAKLVELPFVEVNSDFIIDSHIGNTGTNINKIFNQIKEPCVLFWDEVDTIGRKRGVGSDSAAGMENERMVNSILVNLDKMSDDVIFIGATNRMNVLDSAFLRRFSIKHELPNPTKQEKEKFIIQMVKYYNIPNKYETELICKYYSFDNFSDIKLALTDYARKYILRQLKEKQDL